MKILITLISLFVFTTFNFAQSDSNLAMVNTVSEYSSEAENDFRNQKSDTHIAVVFLQNFIAEHIKYPEQLIDYGQEGDVLVKVVINSQGKIDSMLIMDSFSDSLSKYVLKEMKDCNLSEVLNDRYVGKPSFILPVNFSIN